jgi:small subunit ribosomal protein S7
MPRKGPAPKRVILPDPVFNSRLAAKFINRMLLQGKRAVAEGIFYKAMDLIGERTQANPIEVFEKAMKNVMPVVEVKPRRVGGATYQVPIEVRPDRRQALGIR